MCLNLLPYLAKNAFTLLIGKIVQKLLWPAQAESLFPNNLKYSKWISIAINNIIAIHKKFLREVSSLAIFTDNME